MSKLTLADLQQDLTRKQGGALATVVIDLLTRGKHGRRVLAAALREGPRAENLRDILRDRAGQATELLTRLPDFDTDPDGLSLLSILTLPELGRKAVEMWDRGEHQVALRLATLVEAKGGHYLATLVLARQLDSQGLKQDALVKYEEASTRGASATEIWSEFGAALEEAGRWVEAMDIYRHSYPGPGVPEAMSRLLVRILVGRGRRDAVDCYRVWLQLAAQDPAAGTHIRQQVVTRLVETSSHELEAAGRYLEELGSWVDRVRQAHAAGSGGWPPPVEPAAELLVVADQAAEYASSLHDHLLLWHELAPTPREAAELWSEVPGMEGVEVEIEPGLPRVEVDPARLSLGLASLTTWTRRYWPGPWRLAAAHHDGGVRFQASALEAGSATPRADLSWHTAAIILARHRAELAMTAKGWEVWLPASSPRTVTPLARRLAGLFAASRHSPGWLEEVSTLWQELGTGTPGALQLADAVELAQEELSRCLVAGNTGAVAAACRSLVRELDEVRGAVRASSGPGADLARAGLSRRCVAMELILETARGYLTLADAPVLAYYDPAGAVRPALDRLSPLLARYGVQLELSIAAALPRVKVDPARLALLARELGVGVALAMPPGGSVRVSMVAAGGALTLEAEGRVAGVATETAGESPETSPGEPAEASLMAVQRVARDHHATVAVTREPGGCRVTVSLPAEAGERRLASSLPELAQLGAETRRALLAAEGLSAQPGHDDQVVGFLLGKALNLEVQQRLLPRLERHLLLPGATAGAASGRGEFLAKVLEKSWDRELQGRCQALETAIIKGRQEREWGDLRNLGIAVAAFTPASGTKAPVTWPGADPALLRSLAAALFRCGEVMARAKEGRPLIEPAYRLLSLLARLPATQE